MYTLIVENERGESLELTHNAAYSIQDIDGLDFPDATINTSRTATADGTTFNSAYVNERTIIITMAINGPAETNRINLYKYFKSKKKVTLYYKNGVRDVFIDGYVQKIEVGFFEQKQTAQITIICPKTYFNAVEESVIEFSSVESLFEFPFAIEEEGVEFSSLNPGAQKSIINNGDVDTGVVITLSAVGTVLNPKIYNVDTRESFILDVQMGEGDVITINTKQKEKSVTMTSQGVTTNIIGKLRKGSSWFQLLPGDNIFTYEVDEFPENLNCTFTIIEQFGGV